MTPKVPPKCVQYLIDKYVPKGAVILSIHEFNIGMAAKEPCITWFEGYGRDGSIAFRDSKGDLHRELGAAVFTTTGRISYCLKDLELTYADYWAEMYRRYKGTEHEDTCKAKMLANNS